MNRIEEFIYHLLRNYPKAKFFVRNLYQDIFDFIPINKTFLPNSYDLKEGYFYGFHDTTPFSKDETKVLANRYLIDLQMPSCYDALIVGFFDFREGKMTDFHEISSSYSWNYHKGCRLQWLNEKELIFNTAINNTLVSEIINIYNTEKRIIPHAIDSVYSSSNEVVGTSFSYKRLEAFMPCYGYQYEDNSCIEELYPKETGLFLVDLITGKADLLFSISDLVKKVCEYKKDDYYHYITHTQFSKDGRYISFLYRRSKIGSDVSKRFTNIVVYDRVKDDLITLPTQNSGSHYIWNGNKKLLATCIINGKISHVLYDIDEIDKYKVIMPDCLNQDGHPSFICDHVFVTDTYPDKTRFAQIYKVDLKSNTIDLLVSVKSPKKYQFRDIYNYIDCDLHPRVSPSGNWVCCDTVFTGKRSIMVFPI